MHYMVAMVNGLDLALALRQRKNGVCVWRGGWRGLGMGGMAAFFLPLGVFLVIMALWLGTPHRTPCGKGASFILRFRLCCHCISAARIELWEAGLASFSSLFSLR
jgi:hypothetical protein